MKISIILPYKENFSSQYAGAVSLFLKDTIKLSKYKNFIKVFGSTNYKKDILKYNYINLNINKTFFKSKSKEYIKNFINYENKSKSKIIEIHNRPNYIDQIFKINKNIVLHFHNDPLKIKGSKSIKDRNNIIQKTKKIIFLSKWVKKRFLIGINKKDLSNNHFEIVEHSTNKKKINFANKKKLIIFVGRLNESKGYDIFGEAVINVLNKYPKWKSIVIGDEPREKIFFKHKNLKVLGFQKYNVVSKWFRKADISVVCSRWDEPFGRTALEASSAGCAVIITNRGGLIEASPKAIKIKNLNVKNLEKNIIKLIKNSYYKKSLQKKIYKHFYLSNSYISKKIDKYRSNLIKF